jgi:hypothetical protein
MDLPHLEKIEIKYAVKNLERGTSLLIWTSPYSE